MMLTDDALRAKPILHGQLVVLRQLGLKHSDAFWESLSDPEVRWLTGTHTDFRRDQIDSWLASRSEQHDRLDLAIHRQDDDQYLGELALTEFDPVNESVGVRIALTSTAIAGKGYGSDAMRTILTYAFDTVGIHRVHLDVYAFNTRAIRTYERLGLTHEGRARQSLLWDGARHDALLMSMLRPEWGAGPPPHLDHTTQQSTTSRQSRPAGRTGATTPAGLQPAHDRDKDRT